MFDVFYIGEKPNCFAHEKPVASIEHAQELSSTRYCWVINYLLDYTDFDFLWEPVPWQSEYTHVWPTQWKEFYGAYLVPAQVDIKYHYRNDHIPSNRYPENYRVVVQSTFDQTWLPHPWDPPYIYVFGNQWHPAEKMPTVEYHAPGATERKYMSSPRAILPPNNLNWAVPGNIAAEDLDLSWVPDPGSPAYVYQFSTQHQKTGGPVYTVPGATEVKYINQLKIHSKPVATAIIEIDHLDGNAGCIPDTTKKVRYFDNYRDTLVRIAKSIGTEHEYVWICSSICDYQDFDFSWYPEQWQAAMLHVFPSNEQKFGDTFFMHVPTFAEHGNCKALLEWYSVNYVSRQPVPRRPMPVIQHSFDSQAHAVRSIEFLGPLATFTNTDYVPRDMVTVPLWRKEVKTIVPLSKGATSVIVPKAAVGHIRTQLYDYPYIDKTHRMLKEQPLDIVFISNGESNAEQNWAHLQKVTKGIPNRIVRVDRVNGRVAAYQAALTASTTLWAFCVFAKLEVDAGFDFSWQPDMLQQSKHYIFHAKNPCNGLVYGHQAAIAYNKRLVLENAGAGLDFTMDQLHEVVPVLSGTAHYTDTPWMAWRTAVREVIKLKDDVVKNSSIESAYRLKVWTTTAKGKNAKWSLAGANDGVEYYDSVGGDFVELRKSYDWAWLASYAFMRRSLTTDP